MIIRFLSAVIALTLLAACGEKAPEDYVPLPRAYPRIAVYDSVYTRVTPLPLVWECNSGTQFSVRRAYFSHLVDIVYPAYKAKLHLTFQPIMTESQCYYAITRRQERIDFNIGRADTEVTEFVTPAGFEAALFVTPMSSPVPVQFMAINSGWFVSGDLALNHAPASADSIAPVIRSVERDIIHALKLMR